MFSKPETCPNPLYHEDEKEDQRGEDDEGQTIFQCEGRHVSLVLLTTPNYLVSVSVQRPHNVLTIPLLSHHGLPVTVTNDATGKNIYSVCV